MALDLLEQRAPARAEVPRHAVVELRNEFADGAIDLGKREECAITEFGNDPPGRDLHSDLDFGFVSGFVRARWDNCRFVVLRQIRISTIDRGLVEAGFCDASLDIVTHDDRRDAAKEGKGARMRADPISQGLRPRGFCVCI